VLIFFVEKAKMIYIYIYIYIYITTTYWRFSTRSAKELTQEQGLDTLYKVSTAKKQAAKRKDKLKNLI